MKINFGTIILQQKLGNIPGYNVLLKRNIKTTYVREDYGFQK